MAGLSAALEAAAAGAETTVIESEPQLGGASIQSGGACCIVGTPLQQQAGIADSPQLALEDWERCGGPEADLLWAEQYLERSYDEVFRWCEALGISWHGPKHAEENSVPRLHEPVGAGRAVIDAILAKLRAGGARIMTDARARELTLFEGRVCGATIERRGEQQLLSAQQTVVCSGGFVNDIELLSAEVPAFSDIERVLCGGWRSARGLGHRLLLAAGAGFASLDRVWMYPVGTPNPSDPDGQRGLVARGLEDEIWVDCTGRRFHDETLRGGRSGIHAILSCPGQTCWGLFDVAEWSRLRLLDDENYGTALESTPAQQVDFMSRSRHAWREPTLEALAQRIGVPAHALDETVGEYNAAVADGVDRRHGRDLRGARAIDMADGVCAIQYFPIVQKNLGGVVTDLDGRVLGRTGAPIPGLLAAGEVAGMAGGRINGEAALEGTMFGPSLFSGRVAGRTAAASCARLAIS